MNFLAGLIFALQTEEGVLVAGLVEAGHSCLFFVYAFGIAFELRGLGEGTCLLSLHFIFNYINKKGRKL